MPQKDFFHIPPKYTGDVKIFTANTGVTTQGFQIWQKPKGASLVTMIVIGGGAGGGGGFSRTAGSAGGGGAGGATSGISRFICLAIFLPDTLYIQVGNGGQGGAASANGSNGIPSYVSTTSRLIVTPNLVCYSNQAATSGGGAGTAIAGGTSAGAPGISVTQPTNVWGQWVTQAGLIGAAGGAQTGAVGASLTVWSGGGPLSGGGGGAGCTTTDFAGGDINPTALLDIGSQGYYASGIPIARGGTAAGAGVDGSAGVSRITPLYNTGGGGGGSNNSGQAGNGGAGGYGCGGGGGAAGTTGGRGGNGGSGLVIIVTM